MHKIPDGFVLSSILQINKSTQNLAWILLISLTTPIGSYLGFYLLKGITQYFLGFVLGFAAGTFIFISCISIIPEMMKEEHDHKREKSSQNYFNLFTIVFGYVVIVFLNSFSSHSH